MKVANPYLNFQGNTMEAFDFYRSVLGGEFTNVSRFRDFADNGMGVPEADLDKIANIGLPVGANNVLMGTDVVGDWAPVQQGNNFYVALETDTPEEAERVFSGLAEGGTVEMALQGTEWAEKYGSLRDRFGVGWMVMFTGDVVFGG